MAASLIQSAAGGNGSVNSFGPFTVTSSSASFPSPTTAGNLLVCIVWASESSLGGFGQDSQTINFFAPIGGGLTWSPATPIGQRQWLKGSGNHTGSGGCAIYYIVNAPSTSAAFTVQVSNPSGTVTLAVEFSLYEFSGVQKTDGGGIASVIDATGGYLLDVDWPSGIGGSIITTHQDLIIVAGNGDPVTGGNRTAGTGYTLGHNASVATIGQCQFLLDAPPATYSVLFSSGLAGNYGLAALAFKLIPVTIGTNTCGACPGPQLLNLIPGFSDLPDDVLETNDPAFSLHVGEIAFNATFGMVRCEVFTCIYKNGDTVALPKSCWDGYQYSRNELTYLWGVQSSLDPSTNWISGPDSLWFMNWNVNQSTGDVFCEEWYERSSSADSRLAAKSNDGQLIVFTVAQRQKTTMFMAEPAAYNDIDESKIDIDKPYTQELAQQLNQNAKFACVNAEVFYLGEYTDGQTVTLPVSPVDDYAYSTAECQFMHCWRWTANGANYVQPPGNYEQAAPFQASIDSSGHVSITVTFSTSGGEGVLTASGYGRIAAFAFCQRSATPATAPLADQFAELDLGFFAPGTTVRASEVLQIKRNIDEAILSPEFFGPTDYHDGNTVPLPVSLVDGYTYQRSELQYIWDWSDVHNNSGGSHVRLPLFVGSVDPATGVVKLRCWRLPPGGPFVDDSNSNAKVTVLVMATRQAIHPELVVGVTDGNSPDDAGTFITDDSGDLINGG